MFPHCLQGCCCTASILPYCHRPTHPLIASHLPWSRPGGGGWKSFEHESSRCGAINQMGWPVVGPALPLLTPAYGNSYVAPNCWILIRVLSLTCAVSKEGKSHPLACRNLARSYASYGSSLKAQAPRKHADCIYLPSCSFRAKSASILLKRRKKREVPHT